MRMLLLPLLTLLSFQSLFSADGQLIYKTSSKAPSELSYQVESISLYRFTEVEKNQILTSFSKLDYCLDNLSKQDSYSIIKAEFYKKLLSEHSKEKTNYQYDKIDLGFLLKLQEKAEEDHHRLLVWFFKTTKESVTALYANSVHPSLISMQKTTNFITDKELLIHKKRLDLSLPWLFYFKKNSYELIKEKFKSLITSSLHAEARACINYLALKNRENVQPVFSLTMVNFTPVSKESAKAIDPILKDDLPKEIDNEGITPTGWKPKEKDENEDERSVTEMIDAIVPSIDQTPNPNYQPPKELPKPTNDW